MGKRWVLMGMLLALGLLCACRAQASQWYEMTAEYPPVSEITAAADQAVYDTPNPTVTITVDNASSSSCFSYFRPGFSVQQFRDGQWMYWAETCMEDWQFTTTLERAYLCPDSRLSFDFMLRESMSFPVETGDYRVWMLFTDSSDQTQGEVCAYFTVEKPQ